MSLTKIKQTLEAVGARAAQKPKLERLRTKALGEDPEPVIVFEITDLGTYTFDLTKNEGPFLTEEDDTDAGLRVVTDKATFRSVWKRQEVAWDAVADGRMQLIGNTRLGHGLQRFFDADADLGD